MTAGARPLRIGLVCPYSLDTPGGVQNHVLGLAGYLVAAGHAPHVLAPGDLAAQPGAPGVRFTSAGSAVSVPYNGSVARVNFGPLSAARARRWCREHAFDLLHIHEPITPSVAVLALWAAEVPVVATFHTATPRSRSMHLAGAALRAAVEKIDAGIAVSEAARNVVVQHLGRDAVVVPNGIVRAAFAAGLASAHARRTDRPRVTFLGRVDEPRKGFEVLLAALPALRVQIPEVEVVVAGQGIRALPPGCRTVGSVTDLEKAVLLGSSDVFVAPHTARESFGIVLLEAMAARTAVVASDLPAFRDLLAPPDQPSRGRVVPVGDPVALADATVSALRRPDPEQVQRAYAATARYDWSRVGEEILDVYRATLAAAHPATRAQA